MAHFSLGPIHFSFNISSSPSKELENQIQRIVKGETIALYFNLTNEEKKGLGVEITSILGGEQSMVFKQSLAQQGLEIGIVMRKEAGLSHGGFQAGGYAIIKRDGIKDLAQEVAHKLQNQSKSYNDKNGIPLSNGAIVFIDYMLTQKYRNSLKDLEKILEEEHGLKVKLEQKDIESCLHIFAR